MGQLCPQGLDVALKKLTDLATELDRPLQLWEANELLGGTRRQSSCIVRTAVNRGLLQKCPDGYSTIKFKRSGDAVPGLDVNRNRPSPSLQMVTSSPLSFAIHTYGVKMPQGPQLIEITAAEKTERRRKPRQVAENTEAPNTRRRPLNNFKNLQTMSLVNNTTSLKYYSHNLRDQKDEINKRAVDSLRKMARNATEVEAQLKTQKTFDGKPAEDRIAVQHMVYLFTQHLQTHQKNPYLKPFKKGISPQVYGKFLSACKIADTVGVDYPTYMRAQFYWFEKLFGKAPKLHNICAKQTKFNAGERAKRYATEVAKKRVNPLRKIVSRITTLTAEEAAVDFSLYDQKLSVMMYRHGADALTILSHPLFAELIQTFPEEWKVQVRERAAAGA